MEISNNGTRPQPTNQFANRPQPETHPHHDGRKTKNERTGLMSLKTLYGVLLVGVAILIIATITSVITNTVKNESNYVNKNSYQSVFVNVAGSSGGQAYFGHIQEINSQYIELTGVFYLEPGSTSNQFTLNNLSCALYNPEDTMIIKTDQVVFWENLKSNSQVTTDINKWYTDKLSCSSTASASTSAGATTTGATGTSATGTSGTGTASTTGTGASTTTPSTGTTTTH
jgi:hypothetical protein